MPPIAAHAGRWFGLPAIVFARRSRAWNGDVSNIGTIRRSREKSRIAFAIDRTAKYLQQIVDRTPRTSPIPYIC